MTDGTTAPAPSGDNRVDPTVLANFVKRVEAKVEDQLSEQGTYMQACAKIQAEIKAIKKEAKDAGIAIKEFNTLLKDREFDRKKAKLRTELEPDQLVVYDAMKAGLKGMKGLPLADAALAQQQAKVDQQLATKADPIDQIGRGSPLN